MPGLEGRLPAEEQNSAVVAAEDLVVVEQYAELQLVSVVVIT